MVHRRVQAQLVLRVTQRYMYILGEIFILIKNCNQINRTVLPSDAHTYTTH